MSGTWTLSLDESGRFEPVSAGEESQGIVVLGGVLCPFDAASSDQRWRAALDTACRSLGIRNPHAAELQAAARDELFTAINREVVAADAMWIFVAHEAGDRSSDVVLYARMLAEVVDLAARLAGRRGGHKLEVRPAQRTAPLLPKEAVKATALGLETVGDTDDGRVYVRTIAAAEIRQAIESARREVPGLLPKVPELKSVEVLSAGSSKVHAGVLFADHGCNRMYRLLNRSGESDVAAAFSGSSVVLVGRDALRRYRSIDRWFRSQPVDIVSAANEMYRATSAERETQFVIQEASNRAIEDLWKSSVELLSSRLDDQSARTTAHALYSVSELHLAAKTGSYEGVWRAVETGWAGSGALATQVRTRVRDRELAAKLWRATIECANHRGDVEAAIAAERSFDEICRQGVSIELLAEQLRVTNLACVRLQNQLPAEPAHAEAILYELAANADAQVKAADIAGDIVGLAVASKPAAVPPPESDAERRLWKAVGRAPQWEAPDKERGRNYGTAARSLAFVGDLDKARDAALRARLFFGDSPFDLRFNASVVARIELERARLGAPKEAEPLLLAALELAGATEHADPGAWATAVTKIPGSRFALDLVLRKLLWTQIESRERDRWMRALEKHDQHSMLFALGAKELQTHPTELLSRHAAEVLGAGPAADRWVELSLAVSNAAPVDSAIRRFADFSTRIFERAVGPRGCTTNPSFEYR